MGVGSHTRAYSRSPAGFQAERRRWTCHRARLGELFIVAISRNGADPLIGRRLAELYRHAGLEDVTIEVRAVVYPPGHSRRTIRPDLVLTLRSQILALGAADERELDQLDAAAREHLANPDVLVMPHLYFLAAGRKPPAG